MPELVIGNVPRGEDYFGQEDFIESIWARLKKDNVLLVAPRRFGKTGAMYQLFDSPRGDFIPIYLDVEYITSVSDFMVELIAKLIKKHPLLQFNKTLGKGFKKLEKLTKILPGNIDLGAIKVEIREKTDIQKKWHDYAEQIQSLLTKKNSPILLIIDEFPIMMNHILKTNPEEAKQLLYWFRAVRIAPESMTRFVIGGSINLVSTLDHNGLVDTINDISPLKLSAFTSDTAKRFIKEIFFSKGISYTEEVGNVILEMIGEPIPYLLSVFLTAIIDKARISKHDITIQSVKEAFEDDLLGGSTSAVFLHYHSRLEKYPYYSDTETRAAKAILGTLSRSDKPVKKDTLYQVFLKAATLDPGSQSHEDFGRLMIKLDNDFYLTSKDEKYAFYSKVLRLWWKARYGWGNY
ncbi:MAG: hypothetical protein ACM3SY_19745 [Candidatus Omnitrophota bacterium]